MGHDAGTLSEIGLHAKHCRAEKTVLLTIWNDLQHEFIDMATYHLTMDLDRVLLQLIDILNIVFKY